MTSTEYVAAVTVQAAAAAFNAFTNVSLARESLRAAEEEVAYAAASLATSYARLECAQEVLTAFKAVTPATVFVANNSIGGRYVTASDEARVGFVPAFSMRYADDWEWWGFDTLDLAQPGWEEVIFTSATSGSALRATPRLSGGVWLEFLPSHDRPDYRGAYFESWRRAAGYPLPHGNDEVVCSTSSPGYAVA